MFADSEFAGVELGNNVMNVKNDFTARKLGEEGREHFEVWNRMHMNQLIRVPHVPPRQKESGSEKEQHQFNEIGELPAFVPLPTLNPKHTDTANHLLDVLVRTAEGYDLDFIPARDQRLRVAADAIIVLIKSIHRHAYPHGSKLLSSEAIARSTRCFSNSVEGNNDTPSSG
jgi:hypothetical protein